MLTIQPRLLNTYHPAFKALKQDDDEEIISLENMTEDKYQSMRDDLEDQRNEFENLAEDKSMNLPKPLNKALKAGSIVTTGLLGGMATGWGTKKSLAGLNRLYNSKAMQGVKAESIKLKLATAKTSRSLKTRFLDSTLYKNVSNSVKNSWKKLGEKKAGKPIVDFFNAVGSGIKTIYTKVSDGIGNLWNKIKGVKKETWEKATVNTVGTSGGIAAGVTALKEKDGADE